MDKKFYFKLNSKPEKIISVVALSLAGAIIFDEKKKKEKHPEKYRNIFKRTKRNYRFVDTLISKTLAKDLEKKAKNQFKSKSLQDLEITKGEFIDI